MKLTVLSRVLLFVFAFLFVLSHCTLSVRADGGGGGMTQKTETTLKKNLNKMSKEAADAGNKVMSYYKEPDNNVFGILTLLEQSLKNINEVQKELESKKNTAGGAKDKFEELKQNISRVVDKLNKVKKQEEFTTLKKERQEMKNKMNNLREIFNVQQSNDDNAKKLSDLAKAGEHLLEKIFTKMTAQYVSLMSVVGAFDATRKEMAEKIEMPQGAAEKKDIDEINTLKEKVQTILNTSFDKANKTQTEFERAQKDVIAAVRLYKELSKKAEEAAQELTAKRAENNELNDAVSGGQKNKEKETIEVKQHFTGEDKKEQPQSANFTSDGSGVAVPQFVFILIFVCFLIVVVNNQ